MSDERNVIQIAYGRGSVPLQADPQQADWYVIRPKFSAALPDVENRFRAACRKPVGCRPLNQVISPRDRVVIVTSDGTRAVPNRLLIPWLLDELSVSADQVTVLLGNGSHRANTPAEIEAMFGGDVARSVRILNHDAFDPAQNVFVGTTASGGKASLDRVYVKADKRIVVGFIEPHFFAGFSGGAKGIVPGVASIDTIMHVHSAALIGHPLSTWGTLEGNPIRHEIEEMVGHCPPDFMLNVTLNSDKQITDLFVGHYIQAHRPGCARSKEEAMVAVPQAFPLVISSNSGYPLDQNLYQTVKGMSAAARIVQPGGTILMASECSDGIPNHGNFAELMHMGATPQDILDYVYAQKKVVLDQWQAQIAADVMNKAEVAVYSSLPSQVLTECKLHAVDDLQATVEARIHAIGGRPSVAVLPDGPLTIPYLA
jgi:nickel-dependent lactate racemase